jgi:predicted NBD/HSP70 family sugar kinase
MLVCRPEGSRDFGHLVASLQSLQRRLATAGMALPLSNPLDWPWAEWEPHVAPWLAECGEALAQIILNTSAVIEFDLAVIDGVMPKPLVERLRAETQRALDALPVMTFDRPRLIAGRLGHDAMPLGAAFMPIFRKHFSRDLRDMASWETAPLPE